MYHTHMNIYSSNLMFFLMRYCWCCDCWSTRRRKTSETRNLLFFSALSSFVTFTPPSSAFLAERVDKSENFSSSPSSVFRVVAITPTNESPPLSSDAEDLLTGTFHFCRFSFYFISTSHYIILNTVFICRIHFFTLLSIPAFGRLVS